MPKIVKIITIFCGLFVKVSYILLYFAVIFCIIIKFYRLNYEMIANVSF